ncbi:sigma-70 family RNA polymerase sigma factor [Gordonia aichiensis]|uniref:Putative RNA polymerase ECF-type sigma factor n=1 Tax=Gordonia aichiensis NBRC 108223 TaxID=1220583 RepID=L7KN22_9ACTN|nr:sigma-70 family RNA polymerase sigma factor [Gordonia aichiensis]GAC49901.1 putative RNA polymerase ECF-type sigma factor [Gordonia aichiensis NBRC 108223]
MDERDPDLTIEFERERSRLVRLAARVLGDDTEAHDLVQQAWLRMNSTDAVIENLPAWLTTVTSRLCLDRLRARVPEAAEPTVDERSDDQDPADAVALADSVGLALTMVLDRLSPAERVAFVMHDSFGFEFSTIASALDVTPTTARKLASRARAKVRQPAPDDALADWEVVDAFMAAARDGDFERLLELLAPNAEVRADDEAIAAGTPVAIDGRRSIAEFFNGSASAALPVLVDERPAAAWFHRGAAAVVFDFELVDGEVARITFRADPALLSRVNRRDRDTPRT